jgi:hypothetical protein
MQVLFYFFLTQNCKGKLKVCYFLINFSTELNSHELLEHKSYKGCYANVVDHGNESFPD